MRETKFSRVPWIKLGIQIRPNANIEFLLSVFFGAINNLERDIAVVPLANYAFIPDDNIRKIIIPNVFSKPKSGHQEEKAQEKNNVNPRVLLGILTGLFE